MKNIFIGFTFGVLVLFAGKSFGQKEYSNSLVFATSYHYFPKIYDWYAFQFFLPLPYSHLNIGDQFSVFYERKIAKNWRVGLGYTTRNVVPKFIEINYVGGELLSNGPTSGYIGQILQRRAYKMFDLYVDYQYNKFKKHKIAIGAGVSTTWGTNIIIDTIYVNSGPPFDATTVSHEQKGCYNGVLSTLRYDCLLFKSRVSVGADLKWRKYAVLYSYQIDYGVHASFNF